MLMLFGIFVLFFNDSQASKRTFIIDDVNRCVWEQNVITGATEALDLDLQTVDVNIEDVEGFLLEAAESGKCVAEVGDSAGFYATQLNEQFTQQR